MTVITLWKTAGILQRAPQLQQARPLTDCQPDVRPALDGNREQVARLSKIFRAQETEIEGAANLYYLLHRQQGAQLRPFASNDVGSGANYQPADSLAAVIPITGRL